MLRKCIVLYDNGTANETKIDESLLYYEDNEVIEPYFNNLIPKKCSYGLKWYFGTADMIQWSNVSDDLVLLFACQKKWNIDSYISFISGKKINKAATFLCKKHTVQGNAVLFSKKGNLDLNVLPDMLKKPISFTVNDKYIAYDINNSMVKAVGKYANKYDTVHTFFDELFKYHVLSLEDIYIYLGPMAYDAYIEKDYGFFNSFMDYNIAYTGVSLMLMIDIDAKKKVEDESDNYLYLKPKSVYLHNAKNIELMNTEMCNKGWKKNK
jgi:hypothetical protein